MAAGSASPRPNPSCDTSKVSPRPLPLPLPRPAMLDSLGRGIGMSANNTDPVPTYQRSGY